MRSLRRGGPTTTDGRFNLRQQVFRVDWIDGNFRYVVFGRPIRHLFTDSKILGGYLQLQEFEAMNGHGARPDRRSSDAAESAGTAGVRPYYVDPASLERLSADDLFAELQQYDVISFDIFDTALVRTVEAPNDVFRIMGARLGIADFLEMRKNAESHLRNVKNQMQGTREVVLSEIYELMADRHGAEPSWERLEEDLEVELSRPNPQVKDVYDRLRHLGKRLVFTSDMYLPLNVLERMLARNGYEGYERLYLSNEYGLRKGDGTLQRVLLDEYTPERSIVHIGDNLDADVVKSEAVGLPAIFNPDVRVFRREPDMDSLAGSFYRAVVNNHLGSGTWSKGLHYTHGFRVGGILALGYVEFLERLAQEKSIDKILFCGRDCDVISRIYTRHYGRVESAYIDTSRYAQLGITLEQNYQEYIHRSFFRWLGDSNNTRTIAQVLTDTGFGYLAPHLESADIEQYLFPAGGDPNIIRRRLEQFFWDHRDLVVEHNRVGVDAAKAYFAQAIGDAKRILVVDIGWTGTSAMTLRKFFADSFPEAGLEVFGALMGSSRSRAATDALSSGFLSAYVHSPLANMDLTRFMMPGGRQPVRKTDLLHMPLEYLFTEPKASTTGYAFDANGNPTATRGNNAPHNVEQILEMQDGMLDFVDVFLEYSAGFAEHRFVSPYVAFNPLRGAIENPQYSHRVYKDFHYDAAPTLFAEDVTYERFGTLFEAAGQIPVTDAPEQPSHDSPEDGAVAGTGLGRILFISPEMIHAGAPRSLLRLCKVADSLGYEPVVWTTKLGPFAEEFETHGFPVHVVDPADVTDSKIKELTAAGVRLVVSNTVATDAYVRRFEGRIPLVWYVREASNLPDFLRSNPERADTLRRSTSICCVSDYAAAAIAEFADGPITVVKNAVEDVSKLALPYEPRRGGRHKFVQLGTIEQRKGYDLFVAAYKAMPEAYRDRSELHFAGGFINSGTSFASYVLGQVEQEEHIHYHGLITGERAKVELMSQMDTVVVASRDESCSLVALEGTMLSKPLIVTENVGAKYVVTPESGRVVASGEIAALRDAYMAMIDVDSQALSDMGETSRRAYDQAASMDAHRRDLADLFSRRIAAGPGRKLPLRAVRRRPTRRMAGGHDRPELIVSLTSFPQRIPLVGTCVDSLLAQTTRADAVILWLSADQFPGRDADLPAELLARVGGAFRIEWVEGNLGPHKKYFYAAQRYPRALIVTVDDDAVYSPHLLRNLVAGHVEQPHAVISDRANLALFRPNGDFRSYDGWAYNAGHLRGALTYQLLPTGVGGVLYPPGAIPAEAFDVPAIVKTSLFADDLWLKVMTTANGYPVWMPKERSGYRLIEEAQESALWRANAFQGHNDAALVRVLDHFEHAFGSRTQLVNRVRGIAASGEFVGPRTADFTRLLTEKSVRRSEAGSPPQGTFVSGRAGDAIDRFEAVN